MPKKGTSKYHDSYRKKSTGNIDYSTIRSVNKLKEKQNKKPEQIEKEKKEAFNSGTKKEYLCCPFCGWVKPKEVKLVSDGKPLYVAPSGIVYVKNGDGRWERRFDGPDHSYFPVKALYHRGRTGYYNDDESLTAYTLLAENLGLFKDFYNTALKTFIFFERILHGDKNIKQIGDLIRNNRTASVHETPPIDMGEETP